MGPSLGRWTNGLGTVRLRWPARGQANAVALDAWTPLRPSFCLRATTHTAAVVPMQARTGASGIRMDDSTLSKSTRQYLG